VLGRRGLSKSDVKGEGFLLKQVLGRRGLSKSDVKGEGFLLKQVLGRRGFLSRSPNN
jgi:hypothetical protein